MTDEGNGDGQKGELSRSPLGPLIDEVIPDIAGIPLPPVIQRNFFKSIGHLISAATDIAIAKIESVAKGIRTDADARDLITMASARAAAQLFSGDRELARRALNRFGQKIVEQQRNRESVARLAAEELRHSSKEKDATTEIDDDWLTIFSEVAEKKSNQEVQVYLSKILAGEIRRPGSFSPATIQVLAMLTQRVANHFEHLCNISMRTDRQAMVLAAPYGRPGSNALAKFGLDFSTLIELQSHGLVVSELNAWSDFSKISVPASFEFCGGLAVLSPIKKDCQRPGRESVVLFTPAGTELRTILSMEPNREYVARLKEWFAGYGIRFGLRHPSYM